MNRKIEQERDRIVDEIREINRLRQGIVSEQYYGTGDNRQGPYYVLQGYDGGKHWSKRIPRDQVEKVREDLSAGVRLKELCKNFADLTEKATIAQDNTDSKKNSVKQTKRDIRRPKTS